MFADILCVFVLFQNTVAKYAPQFITSEQQDAQEFLAFVTDGSSINLDDPYRKFTHLSLL